MYFIQFAPSGEALGSGLALSDLSDAGIITDPNSNGDPADAGEDDPTAIVIGEETSLGAAKTASVNGNEVTFDIYLGKPGQCNAQQSIVARPSGREVFGAGNYNLSSGPTLIIDPGTVILNAAYDGSVNTELLDSASTLASDAIAQIQMVVDVTSIVDQGLGTGSYENQVVAAGTAPLGSLAQDVSDAGTDPDPNGNNDPADAGENDPTAFMLALDLPVVGIAKQATVAGSQVTFDVFIENLGNTLLSNFSLFEDLDAVFGAGNYSFISGPDLISPRQDLEINTNFDGSANKQLITGGSLLIGDIEQIRFVVDVATLTDQGSGVGVYSNQVTVNAEGPGNVAVSDLSDNGTDPDPNGNHNPADPGENDPTVFSIAQVPVIGVATTAAVANRTVTLDFYLENFGNVTLNNLSLIEDLDAVFGAGNYSISSAPTLIVDPGTVTLNGAYDGSANSDILVPGSSTLALGTTVQIRMTVEITTVTDQGLGLGQYENQVTASATSPDNTPSTDLSDDGTDPDPNGNNDPADADENDPTLIVLGAAINGFIWNDLNGDGIQDADEPGLSGITVFLSPIGTVSGTSGNSVITPVKASPMPGDPVAVTVNGDYTFTDLPAGSYLVQVDESTLPIGARLTTANLPQAATLFLGEDFNAARIGFRIFSLNVPSPKDIPSLNKWGLAAMIVLLLLGLLWRRRVQSQH
ncbi:MAG: SdrD B-like domain-containing protein [Gammaproteobacteria bacterium]